MFSSGGAVIVDLSIWGVRIPQTEVLFYIRVLDTDTQSYCDCTPSAVLSSTEHEKTRKYSQACQDRRATFTPLCMSTDGIMGHEFRQWDRDYGGMGLY